MVRRRRWRTTEAMQEQARQLRREQTPAERKLWARLRQRQIYGLRFRRQHPIGRFIVDFCCISHKLVIEIDGRTHDAQMAYDQARAELLQGQGYKVVRFTNSEVEREMDGVLAEIVRECGVGE